MSDQNNIPKDLDPRFAASVNPDREHYSFEMPKSLADEMFDCAATAFKQDISFSRAELMRAALYLAIPIFQKRPNLVKHINHVLIHGNSKKKRYI